MYQLKQVPSTAQIKKYLRRILFGKDVFCPKCKSQRIMRYEERFRCRNCRTKFSLLSHTWLKDQKVGLQKFWLILWSWVNEIPVKQTQALTKLSEEAVRHWFDLFRSHLPDDPVILEKLVQLDEAFFKKRALILGKEIGTRKLAWEMLTTTNVARHHAFYFLENHVKPESQLNTDGASIYRGIEDWWPVDHRMDIHKKWEFALTSEIEGAFGNLKTFIRRMYHHSTPGKLGEYVREFCIRFSLPKMFEDPYCYLEKSLKLVPID